MRWPWSKPVLDPFWRQEAIKLGHALHCCSLAAEEILRRRGVSDPASITELEMSNLTADAQDAWGIWRVCDEAITGVADAVGRER